MYEVDTDVDVSSNKWSKPTLAVPRSTATSATSKPAAVSKAPKGTGFDELKGLDNEELDYDDDCVNVDDEPSKTQQDSKDEGFMNPGKPSEPLHHHSGYGSTEHQWDHPPDVEKPKDRPRSKSRSRSPHGSCSPLPDHGACSVKGSHVGDLSRDCDKDHAPDWDSHCSSGWDRYRYDDCDRY